ncbi:MAG: FAD-binding oxidoreductase [Alphaproteobacteria bacterium]
MASGIMNNRHGTGVVDHAEAVAALSARLRGALVRPADAGYDAARAIYNAMHDRRRPGLIVQAADVADVMATVDFAREHGLLLAVRGGGHNVAGFATCDDGIVLDLKRLKGIRVDPERKTVRAEGGCTWGDLDHATHGFGMAVPGGVVSTTGIAGLTLGGGMGHLSRRGGLSCDNLVSADVVTADGRFLTCDADRHPDLFWALRGGGGNFGVVTAFEYKLHSVAEVLGGPTFYQPDPGVFRGYEAMLDRAPDDLQAIFAFTLAPAVPFVPDNWHGKPVMAVVACWSGDSAEDALTAARLSGLGTVVGQAMWRMPYPEINTLFDAALPHGLQHYWKANVVHAVPDAALAAHIEHGAKVPHPASGTFLFPIDRACHRLGAADTAFPHRDARYSVIFSGSWPDRADNDANIAWVRNAHAALRPWSDEGGYGNFMSDTEDGQVRANYGPNHARLQAVKRQYDPDNLFRLNQNILPG